MKTLMFCISILAVSMVGCTSRQAKVDKNQSQAEDQAQMESIILDATAKEAELEKQRIAEELAKQQAAEELAKKQAAEELAKQQAAEELAKQQAEELAKKQAAEELMKKMIAEEVAKQLAEAKIAEQKAAGTVKEADSEESATEAPATEETASEEAATEIVKEATAVEPTPASAGFRNFKRDCSMRTSAGLDGKIVGYIKGGQKLWTEDQGNGWLKVFRTVGYAFVSNDECL